MASIQKLIRLINLLHNRRKLTLDEIQVELGVTRRTVYRYINRISEANIPVYFDSEIKGYTILGRNSSKIGQLSDREAILLLLALRIISSRVKENDIEVIESLQKRLDSFQSHSFQEFVSNPSDSLLANLPEGGLTDLVTFLVIQSAIHQGKKVSVSIDGTSQITEIDVSQPSLRFDGKWRICGVSNGNPLKIDLDHVLSAQIH